MLETIKIWTDGGCRGNQKPENIGGYGIVVDAGGPHRVLDVTGYEYNTTNNRMELEAVVHILESMAEHFKSENLEVTIYTDSNYVAQAAVAWVYNWRRNNWLTARNEPVANKDQWLRYLVAAKEYKSVMVVHIPRDSHPNNIRADSLANKAMDEAEEELITRR